MMRRWQGTLIVLLAFLHAKAAPRQRAPTGQAAAETGSDDLSPFVTEGMQQCYERLSENSACCLDEEVPAGPVRRTVRRPGTAWECSEEAGCLDATWGGQGARGEDTVWTPPGADCGSPRVLYLHGGGWKFGSPLRTGYKGFGAKLALLTGAVVMLVDYPLMPIGNCASITRFGLDALRWLEGHGPKGLPCPGDHSAPLFVGGDSSGGGSALSVTMLAHSKPSEWPTIAGTFAFSPWTNLKCDSPSYYFNSFATRKTAVRERTIYVGDILYQLPASSNSDQYLPAAKAYVANDGLMLTDPICSPYYATQELEGLAPLLLVASSTESLSGDSVEVASKAAQFGVEVYLDLYPGMWHVFPMYSEGCGSGHRVWQADVALNRTAEFVRVLAARTCAGKESLAEGQAASCNNAAAAAVTAVHYGVKPPARASLFAAAPALRRRAAGVAAPGRPMSRLWASLPPLLGQPWTPGWRDTVVFASGVACCALLSSVWRAASRGCCHDAGGEGDAAHVGYGMLR